MNDLRAFRRMILRIIADEGGSWTASRAHRHARAHGGSNDTYDALDHHTRHGRLTYGAGGDDGIGTWRLSA